MHRNISVADYTRIFSALVADFRTEESEHALAIEDEYEGDHDGETDDEDSDPKHLFHHLKVALRTFGFF